MKHKKPIVCLLLLLGLNLNGLHAQHAIPAAGGEAAGSGGTVNYSIGQVVYTTNAGSGGSVGQGIQQPFEIIVVSGIEEGKAISLRCKAFPNPANDFLILTVDGEMPKQYQALLYDINGKLLSITNLENNETRIDMKNLLPAIYFLKIVETRQALSLQEIKTFKIIKN